MNEASSFTRRDVTLANWRTAPYSRWSFQHVEEIVPVATVALSGAREPDAGAAALRDVAVTAPGGGTVGLVEHLETSFTDSFVAMRDGSVFAEWHAPHADPARPHVIFSISKSVTGMMAGVAAGDGVLDPDAPVGRYVPVPERTAYAQARVRDLLDMTVAVDFDEEYLDADGAFDRYRRAMLWNPERAGTRPETMEAFLASLGATGAAHGERFYYASPNTDMLGLVVERATGRRYADYLAERLWKPMGAVGTAWVTVDREGTARAAGGVCVTPHDLARLGQLVLDGGRNAAGEQVIPAAWIDDMLQNGDRRAWRDGNFSDMFADGRYRSCWYQSGDARGSFCGVGIHGQWLWIDPESRVVIARTSSRPDASDDEATMREVAVLGQAARLL